MKLSELQIVILKCPYVKWSDPVVPKLFGDIVTLKLDGYRPKHPFGIMPTDGSDFICDHLLLCKKSGNRLRPIAGLKSFNYGLIDCFDTEFPPYQFLKKFNNLDHLNIVQSIVGNCIDAGRQIEYSGSFTIDPNQNFSRKDVCDILDIITAAIYGHFNEQNIEESIAIGIPRFRTDQVLAGMGYSPLLKDAQLLDNILLPSFGSLETTLMYLNSFSDQAISLFQQYQFLWKNRIEIGESALDAKYSNSEAA